MSAPLYALYGLWVFWLVSWHVAMFWQAKTTVSGSGNSARYVLGSIVAFILLLTLPGHYGYPPPVLWTISETGAWIAVACAAIGILFMWWARIHLGRLWSGGIVTKEGMRVVDSGPYAIVRHPIYTGLFLTAAATLAVKGDALTLSGFIALVVLYTVKAREEERFLAAQLGRAYDDYRARVKMLVPFVA